MTMPECGRRTEALDLLSDLTPAQQEAVRHREGPLLILAGAGSGKTRVITRRVAYLIQQGVRPSHILAITFTNKAAGEMQRRVEELLPGHRVWISTFHRFGARLLRQYGERINLDRNFTIYDQADRVKVVKAALDAANLDNIRFTPETLMNAISRAKNQLLTPEKYASQTRDYFTQTVAHVYPAYEKRLRESNALDFDDLLYWPALALKNDPELRTELDARFRFILIDEYQDTNKAQYAIARSLSVDQPNLCVVGDPDQSIYKFRGSDIRNILDFERDFPDTRVISLERNYRSTKAILKAASHVIAHNKQRKPKDLNTENPEGMPVTVLTYETGVEEADGIATRIREAVAQQRRHFRDFAVFLRLNALSRSLETAFLKQRIPFQIVRGLAFYERKENRDVLAYLRLLLNPKDDVSFLRIVNEPPRGIGKTSLDRLQEYAAPREISLLAAAAQVQKITTIKGKAVKGLQEFVQLMAGLRQFQDAPPDEVLRQVIDRTGYRKMLQSSGDEDDQERLANVEEFITAAKQFAEEDPKRTIGDFLENITLASDIDGWDAEQDCVSVMTLHASKGLEFPVVYVAAVEQGILPHERSLEKDDEVEEERRLTFVGMTRAKEELYLTQVRLREFRGQTLYAVPSMFLYELPREGIEEQDLSSSTENRNRIMNDWRGGSPAAAAGWIDAGFLLQREDAGAKKGKQERGQDIREGTLVQHEEYGLGKVLSVSGVGALRKVKVLFATGGERTFVTAQAKLTIVKPE
jgi:DNA helicase-2/ATP-dependent DNA helicase PcrA